MVDVGSAKQEDTKFTSENEGSILFFHYCLFSYNKMFSAYFIRLLFTVSLNGRQVVEILKTQRKTNCV